MRLSSLEMIDRQRGWAIHQDKGEIAHILRTEDGGATWIDVSPPILLPAAEEAGPLRQPVSAHFLDHERAWASYKTWPLGNFDSVWRTTNGGQGWEQVPLGRRNFGEDWILFDSVDSMHGWAVVDIFHGAGSHSGEAFRTLDGGRTWERLYWDFGHASGLDFIDGQVGWISTDVFAGVSPPWRLYITGDGGLSWQSTAANTDLPPPEPLPGHRECDFRLLRALSDQSVLIHRPKCATRDADGMVAATSWLDFTGDGGRSWQFRQMPNGPPEFIDEENGWVIGTAGVSPSGQPSAWTLFRTTNGGRDWQTVRAMEWSGELSFIDDQYGWGLDLDGTLQMTTNGGANWQRIGARSTRSPGAEDVTARVQLPTELSTIRASNSDRLQLLATLPASDPTSIAIFRGRLYVGNAQGQLLNWPLGAAMPPKPAIWWAHDDWIYDLAAVEKGGLLVSASRDGRIRRWHVFDLQGYWDEISTHSGEVSAVALAPDGQLLASAGEDGAIHVQQAVGVQDPASQVELAGHPGWTWDLAFAPDGTDLASAGADHSARLWSLESGRQKTTLTGHSSTVSQVAFNPDGGQLATASWDGDVILWNAATGQRTHTLRGHRDWVLALGYAPEGKLLASAGADGQLLLWDSVRGELLAELTSGPSPIRGLAFDEEGSYLAAVADDDRVYLWGIPAD